MPFTPAHAAAALPFRRVRALPMDALVVGTMVPDLPLFVSFAPDYMFTHSRLFAVPVCLPYGIALLLLARFARPSSVWLLPDWVRARLPEHAPRAGTETSWGRVCAALALGVVTHVIWDSFTHEDHLGVRLLPVLAQTWLPVSPIGALPGFKVLQYASSVLGLAAVALAARSALLRRAATEVSRSRAATRVRIAIWTLVLAVGPLLSLARAYAHARREENFKHVFTHDFAGGALLFAAIVLLVFAAGRALLAPSLHEGRGD